MANNCRPQIVIPWIILLLVQSLSVSALSPDSDVIVLTLWTEPGKTPSTVDSSSRTLSKEEISKAVLEDARWILSGMIYGFEVQYVPSDKNRRVTGRFTAEPVVTLPFGDPALRVFKTWTENGRFFIQIRYTLQDFQQRRLRAWSSNIFPEAGGMGSASLYKGPSGRIDSIKEGIKNALHTYLRVKVKNKPREIDARVILDAPPYITIQAGGYTAKVRIKFALDRIIPYGAY